MSWHRDWHGERMRIGIGDLSFGGEQGPGGEFSVEFSFWHDLGEFSEFGPGWPKDWRQKTDFVSHFFFLCLWRWGIYISVRGKKAP